MTVANEKMGIFRRNWISRLLAVCILAIAPASSGLFIEDLFLSEDNFNEIVDSYVSHLIQTRELNTYSDMFCRADALLLNKNFPGSFNLKEGFTKTFFNGESALDKVKISFRSAFKTKNFNLAFDYYKRLQGPPLDVKSMQVRARIKSLMEKNDCKPVRDSSLDWGPDYCDCDNYSYLRALRYIKDSTKGTTNMVNINSKNPAYSKLNESFETYGLNLGWAAQIPTSKTARNLLAAYIRDILNDTSNKQYNEICTTITTWENAAKKRSAESNFLHPQTSIAVFGYVSHQLDRVQNFVNSLTPSVELVDSTHLYTLLQNVLNTNPELSLKKIALNSNTEDELYNHFVRDWHLLTIPQATDLVTTGATINGANVFTYVDNGKAKRLTGTYIVTSFVGYDKAKLLQILKNFLSNASILHSTINEQSVTVVLRSLNVHPVMVTTADGCWKDDFNGLTLNLVYSSIVQRWQLQSGWPMALPAK